MLLICSSSSIRLYVLLVLCKLGKQAGSLVTELNLFGMFLRKRYVDLLRFGLLASQDIHMPYKGRVLVAYRNYFPRILSVLLGVCNGLRTAIMGKTFCRACDYRTWLNLKEPSSVSGREKYRMKSWFS